MRRLLESSLTALLAAGCAGHDVAGPPAKPATVFDDHSPALISVSSKVSAPWLGALDDAIARLVPALGPSGVSLGTPLRALRDVSGGTVNARLLATIRQQFESIAQKLPPALAPDASALRVTLDALGTVAGN